MVNAQEPPSAVGSVHVPYYTLVNDIVLDGTAAYVGTNSNGYVLDVADPTAPVVMPGDGEYEWHFVTGFSGPGSRANIALIEERLYSVWGLSVVRAYDRSDPLNLSWTPEHDVEIDIPLTIASAGSNLVVGGYDQVVGSLDFHVVDGWRINSIDTGSLRLEALAASGNFAYAVDRQVEVSPTARLRVIDVSNPLAPQTRGSVPITELPEYADTTSIAVYGEHAYVGAANGLFVVDVSNPDAPMVVGAIAMSRVYDLQVIGDYAYLAAEPGFVIADVSNPAVPTIAVSVNSSSGYRTRAIDVGGQHAILGDQNGWIMVYGLGDYAPETQLPPGADLAIYKSDDRDIAVVGENLGYRVRVTNYGPDTATGVVLTDTLPANADFINATPPPGGTCNPPALGVLTCNLADLPSGASAITDITVRPTMDGTLLNQASVTANEADPQLIDNQVSQHTPACAVELVVSASDAPDPILPGYYVIYSIDVTNRGYAQASGIVLTDTLPANADFISAAIPATSGFCNAPVAGELQCVIDTLGGGENAEVTVVVRTTTEGRIFNSASVTSPQSDCNPDNNTANNQTRVGALLVDYVPTGWNPMLAVNQNGKAHIASAAVDPQENATLGYSSNASGAWTYRSLGDELTLDAFRRGSQAIAVDSDGHSHISYVGNERFRYASNKSGTWSWKTLDSASTQANGIAASAIAVDSRDKVHAVFCDDDGCNYFTNRSGSWKGKIAGCAGRAVAIVLDSNDEPHISCHQRFWVWYSVPDGSGGWIRHLVDEGCCQCEAMFTSLVLDDQDRPHISYTAAEDINCVSQQEISKYALRDAGQWSITPLDDGEFYSSGNAIAIDAAGNLHVPYYHKPSETLRYTTDETGAWDSSTIEGIGFCGARFTPSAVADDVGLVHMVYESLAGTGGPYTRYIRVSVLEDADHDRVSDIEEQGPDGIDPGYDGNADGTADSQQENVASLHSHDDAYYVTLASESGTLLADVAAENNPSESDAPDDWDFPFGFYGFTVLGATASGGTTVTLYLPAGTTVDTYYKYGPTPADPTPHWYEFLFDGQTGAEINGNVIVLHFVDGQRGDDDLSANGIITDDGAPATPRDVVPPPDGDDDDGNGDGGTCFIATAAYGTPLHADLNTLREFRDEYLLSNSPGRAFVSWYYEHSPAAASYIAEREWLRALVRAALAVIVYGIKYPLGAFALLLFVLFPFAWRRLRQWILP